MVTKINAKANLVHTITRSSPTGITANMTKAQILQQAGIAMVSQANSIPNGVLSLLKG